MSEPVDGGPQVPRSHLSEAEAKSAEFVKVFGVSDIELRQRGIDPGEYARQNIRAAVNDKKNRTRWLPDEDNYALLWTQWGWRGFVGLFLALGLTALGKAVPELKSASLVLSILDMVAVCGMGALMFKYRRLERIARRQHGETHS